MLNLLSKIRRESLGDRQKKNDEVRLAELKGELDELIDELIRMDEELADKTETDN